MYKLIDLLFGNIFIVVIFCLGFYLFKVYKDLKDKQNQIKEKFDKVLDKYLQTKLDEAQNIVKSVADEYKDVDIIKTEINRLLMTIEKGTKGQINEKVQTSNEINKFKLNKQIDTEKYPSLLKLNSIGTFIEEDMNSLDNGVALARSEYNALAFRYNEKASGFPIQYLTKFLGLNSNYIIFDPPKSKAYEEKYEVFEEKEPEINSISILNRQNKPPKENIVNEQIKQQEPPINTTDSVLKPTNSLNNFENQNTNEKTN